MRVEWLKITPPALQNYRIVTFHKHVSHRYRTVIDLRYSHSLRRRSLGLVLENLPSMNPQYLRALPRASNSVSTALRPSTRTEITRFYATQSNPGSTPRPRRRNVTVLNDDGRYEWSELSGKEKVSRATQQSVNFMVVIAGAVLTGGVFYLFWTEIVSPNSRTWQFEKAVDRIKEDSRCTKLLGDRREIRAFGENTTSRWQRNRPIA